MAPRKLLAAAGVLLALTLALALLRTPGPRPGPDGNGQAQAGAGVPGRGTPPAGPLASAAAAARSGLFGASLLDGMLQPGLRAPAGAGGASPASGEGGLPREEALRDPGPAGAAARPGASAAAVAGEAGRPKLELIRMKEIERGERRMYGEGRGRTPSRPVRQAGIAPPNETELISSFSSFLKRLNAAAPASEGTFDQEERRRSSASPYGESQAAVADPIDERHRTPSMELLHGMNLDAVHALQMSGNPGLQDGSKDKAGKRFDGNLKTFDFVPVEKTQGAFGTTVIRRSGADEADD